MGIDELPARELHDRAVKLAVHRLDVGFLWSLVKALPAAEVAAGNLQDADVDIVAMRGLLNDIVHSGDGALAEALRPFYVAYLREHGSEEE